MFFLSEIPIYQVGIRFVEGLDKFWDFFGRYLKVIINGEDKIPFCVFHSAEYGIVLPEVPRKPDCNHLFRELFFEFGKYFPALIKAAIVHKHYFE